MLCKSRDKSHLSIPYMIHYNLSFEAILILTWTVTQCCTSKSVISIYFDIFMTTTSAIRSTVGIAATFSECHPYFGRNNIWLGSPFEFQVITVFHAFVTPINCVWKNLCCDKRLSPDTRLEHASSQLVLKRM